MSTPIEKLVHLSACNEALAWVDSRRDYAPNKLWRMCNDGSWLLWFAARVAVDKRLVVQAACACARMSLEHVRFDDDRPRAAIEMAEAWAQGNAKTENVAPAATAASRSAREISVLTYEASYFASAAAARAASVVFSTHLEESSDSLNFSAANSISQVAILASSSIAARNPYTLGEASSAIARADSLAESARIVRKILPWKLVRKPAKTAAINAHERFSIGG